MVVVRSYSATDATQGRDPQGRDIQALAQLTRCCTAHQTNHLDGSVEGSMNHPRCDMLQGNLAVRQMVEPKHRTPHGIEISG